MRDIIVKIQYAIWAFNRVSQPHIGDVVKYNGEPCSLIQGVANPYWDLLPLNEESLAKSKRDVHRHIHVSSFELDASLKRKWWAFRSSYDFMMKNWFSIDVRKPSLFAPVQKL